MVLTKGTNCGFVTVAPTADPEATNATTDNFVVAGKFTAPSGDNKITQIGFYIDNATEAANMDVGIYSHDAAADEPNALLASSGAFAKGTTAGWKSAIVNYNLISGEIYWLACVLNNTTTASQMNITATGGELMNDYSDGTPLDNPWGTNLEAPANLLAIYALYAPIPKGSEIGQQEIKRDYPVVEGLEATQKHHGSENFLVPEEKSLIDTYGNQTRGLG